MVPVALGTQTQGSTLRPASYCGIVGFKPTHGVLSMQGVHPISATHDHMGVLGGTLEDTWRIASRISLVHGNPGHAFLHRAGEKPPRPAKPRRLIRLYTDAWDREVDCATRSAFEAIVEQMQRRGVAVASRDNDQSARALEALLTDDFVRRSLDITAYEMKWPYQQYIADHGERVEKRVHDRMTQAQALRPEDYTARLTEKAEVRRKARMLMRGFDGIVTLAASGPAPVGLEHTGSRAFLVHATFLGLPAFSLPLMRVDEMPLGLQLIGAAGKDGTLCATANWMMRELGV
jgi:Asp-tRNA(Asn)/Glu-tRNA(Gln) amidotransferase A subunit family amidase